MNNLENVEYKNFEEIKRVRKDGSEYWEARELSKVLKYEKWQNFSKVIEKAKIACQNSLGNTNNDFTDVSKIVAVGALQKKNSRL